MLYFQTWKIVLVLGICALGILFASPNVVPPEWRENMPGWASQTLNLGLDLQGGVHLLWEVDSSELISSRLENLESDARIELIANDISYVGLEVRDGELRFQVRDPAQLSQARQIMQDMATPVSNTGIVGGGGGLDLAVSVDEATDVVTTVLTEEALDAMVGHAVTQSIEIVRRRIDELGTREPTIQRQGRDRIIVQVPGESDPQRIKDIVGTTAHLEFRMHDESVSLGDAIAGDIPPGSGLYNYPGDPSGYGQILLRNRVVLDGERLIGAQPAFDQYGEPVVSIRFDTRGARIFGNITRDAVGERFAILLDDEVLTAPVIREAIVTGNAQISGSFTPDTANDLAVLLRAGALPAPLTVVEERTVGPQLGQDSIEAGQMAAVIGLALVLVFMIATYGLFGVFADIALFVNLVLIAGALSFLQATLTLPGIAGIILTIGMAVDANVLIFERIREEIRSGKTPMNAVDTGYSRAMSTILDANITTLIAAVILFFMGAGPVRGFAVTLGIGIITSVFTAVTFTRLLVATWLRARRPEQLAI